MYRNKLLIALIAMAASLVTLLSQETLSYYSVFGEATNVITSGEVSIRIVERMGDKELPVEGVYIMPGATFSKKVSVRNNGENPCWLRVKLYNGVDDETLSPDVFELDINDTDWIVGDDGFYYYKKILQPETETEILFTQIKIAGKADNRYIGKSLKLTVSAYAVQSEYNDKAATPLDVVGWPAEK